MSINNGSEIVGGAYISDRYQAVIWPQGVMRELVPSEGEYQFDAWKINNIGCVLGHVSRNRNGRQPSLWMDGTVLVWEYLRVFTGIPWESAIKDRL